MHYTTGMTMRDEALYVSLSDEHRDGCGYNQCQLLYLLS